MQQYPPKGIRTRNGVRGKKENNYGAGKEEGTGKEMFILGREQSLQEGNALGVGKGELYRRNKGKNPLNGIKNSQYNGNGEEEGVC